MFRVHRVVVAAKIPGKVWVMLLRGGYVIALLKMADAFRFLKLCLQTIAYTTAPIVLTGVPMM